MADKKKLTNAVLERAKESNGRKQLKCAEAFEIAQEFEADIIEIGRICNRLGIKICKCQLGCFL